MNVLLQKYKRAYKGLSDVSLMASDQIAEVAREAMADCINLGDSHEDDVLVRIMREIKDHDANHPDHGVGCSCMDRHASDLRNVIEQELGKYDNQGYKSRANFRTVLSYIMR